MNSVNKTMYIPLYGKSVVSRKGLFLSDPRAERIWEQEGFPLGGRSASIWLAYTMGIRAAVFDDWLRAQMEQIPDGAEKLISNYADDMGQTLRPYEAKVYRY